MCIWLLVSILSPVVVPLCFALLINLLVDTGKDFCDMLAMLFSGGAYIFLSLFVLVSLIPHFFEKTFEQEESYRIIVAAYMLVTITVLIITCFLYLCFLSLIPNSKTLDDNFSTSISVTIIGIIMAIGFKARILFLQKKKNQISNEYNIPTANFEF